jgi:hypothetical protein
MVGEESRRVVTPATAAVAELAGGGPPPVSESQSLEDARQVPVRIHDIIEVRAK